MLHLLLHGTSLYDDHVQGPVILTPIAELSLIDFTTWVHHGWDSNTQPSACKTIALKHCTAAMVIMHLVYI